MLRTKSPTATQLPFAGIDGQLDLNGNSDTIGPLTFVGGDVITGTGLLTLGGDMTVAPGPSATLSGNLSLGAVTRTINSTNPADLDIRASISGGLGAGLTVIGTSLRISGSNSYSGPTTIAEGSYLEIDHPLALGNTNTPITVGRGAFFL